MSTSTSTTIHVSNTESPIAENQFHLLHQCTTQQPREFMTINDYIQYLFCCLPTIYHNHLICYQLPIGFKLYQCKSASEFDNIFYLTVPDACSNVSCSTISEFTVQKPNTILIADYVSNLQVITATALRDQMKDVVDALEKFDITSKNKTSLTHILQYLNTIGLSGLSYHNTTKRPAMIVLNQPNLLLLK